MKKHTYDEKSSRPTSSSVREVGPTYNARPGEATLMRTTIMLPQSLRREAMVHAKKRGTSLGGLIRDVLLQEVEGGRLTFLDKDIVFRGKPAKGAPKHHDDIYS